MRQLDLISAQNDEYVFVPSKYVVENLQKPDHNEVRQYNAKLCAPEVARYNGYTATIDVNLPFNLDWKPTLGVVFIKVSNTTDFTTSYCTNVDSSGNPVRSCNFTFTEDIGPDLHFQVTAGTAGNIQYSFGLEFIGNSTKKFVSHSDRPHKTTAFPRKIPIVGDDYKPEMLPIVRLSTPGSVNTTDSVYYEFSICPTSEKYDVIVTIVGTDTHSAFSTYLCNSRVCVPDVPGVVGYDVSDTSFNVATAGVAEFMPGGTVFVLITGFGGEQVNSFELAARLFPTV